MATFPALPLWTDAYLSDTDHLTFEEHGVYLRLLMMIWRNPECGCASHRNTSIRPCSPSWKSTWTTRETTSHHADYSANTNMCAKRPFNRAFGLSHGGIRKKVYAMAMREVALPWHCQTPTPTQPHKITFLISH